MRIPLSMLLGIAATACIVAPQATANSPAPSRAEIDAQQARVNQLESESAQIGQEARDLAGTRNLTQKINEANNTINQLRVDSDKLEEAVKQAGATQDELKAVREGAESGEIIGASDVAEEGAEKALEKAAGKVVGAVSRRVISVVGIVFDVLEYGGKFYYRRRTVNSLEENEQLNDATRRELIGLWSAVIKQTNDLIAKKKAMEDLRERDRDNFRQLATERQKLDQMKAARNTPRDTDAAGDAVLQAEEDAERAKRRKLSVRPSNISLSGAYMFGEWQGPRPIYIGTENNLQVQFFGVEGLETDDNFDGFDGHVAFGVDEGSAVILGAMHNTVSFGSAREEFDPLGQRLLLPGVETPGLALGSGVAEGTAGGFNVVRNLHYRFEADQTTAYGAFVRTYDGADGTFALYGGLSFTQGSQTQSLTGDIPGYGAAFSFRYDTDLDINATRAILGARVTLEPFDDAPWFHVNAGVTLAGGFAHADGPDRRIVNNTTETLDLDRNETVFGVSVGAGLEADVCESATLFANYRYGEDTLTPIVTRHDDGPSRLDFERAVTHTVMLGVRYEF
ncbi:MAG TPA: hypothetical protein DCL54_12055 [Alphaproteobacteria bacterium]|nr:hypothetical protein [Alphaproteobacteria bacterium]HAJ47301.1 hypothetical protein [Alphaproteobacteria bacterium]